MTQAVDEAKLGEFMGQMVGYMTGGAMCFGVWLGDELGLYRVLTEIGPATADEVAARAGCNARLTREWLDGQVAGRPRRLGRLHRPLRADAGSRALALADDNSPAFVARGMNAFASMFIDMPKIAAAFRGDGALSWGDHHPCLFSGTEWFFRTGYRAELPNWIAALDGVADKLAAGGTVADVGCGHGASVVVLAQTFPNARITGFDFHPPSIETARLRAEEAGVTAQTTFEVADAKSYTGTYDLICFFDCLHDMGDPVGIARLRPGASRRRRHDPARRAVRHRRPGREHRRQPDGGAALHGVVDDLHAQLAVPGGRPRPRCAGRRGTPAAGVRGGGLHPVPPGRRDADEPRPRSQALRWFGAAA